MVFPILQGGGIDNIKRMNSLFEYKFTSLPDIRSHEFKLKVSDVFEYIAIKSKLGDKELYQTFNMGMGLVLAVPNLNSEKILSFIQSLGEEAWIIGKVT